MSNSKCAGIGYSTYWVERFELIRCVESYTPRGQFPPIAPVASNWSYGIPACFHARASPLPTYPAPMTQNRLVVPSLITTSNCYSTVATVM
ncbi:hypothetical protein [Amycolatopsis sp. YIM 10]|uniref:hypothetical protein n=1 Tax=Amycolatopsis sp. YIM 10 TaxID=2653857 RepID=UPI0012A8B5E4|nr:hypothetical protein [Amycolatopsis sp. YIM 10]QFU87080.1 hypothetical protein YIM_09360 [Amycolatopsis sp. YIM 10]